MTHTRNRSDITEHPKQNNKDLTMDLGGQFILDSSGQGYWLFHNEYLIILV